MKEATRCRHVECAERNVANRVWRREPEFAAEPRSLRPSPCPPEVPVLGAKSIILTFRSNILPQIIHIQIFDKKEEESMCLKGSVRPLSS